MCHMFRFENSYLYTLVSSWNKTRFAFHLSTLAMSSLEYHPTSTSFDCLSLLVKVLFRSLVKRSWQDNMRMNDYATHWFQLYAFMQFLFCMTLGYENDWAKTKLMTLSKLQASNCLAIRSWSLEFFHSSCNHLSTLHFPSPLSSHKRRSFALSALSALYWEARDEWTMRLCNFQHMEHVFSSRL